MSKNKEVDQLAHLASKSRTGMFSILIFSLVLLLVYWLWFGLELSQQLSTNSDRWGAFGDFFGGIMNPMVALFATYWLISSIHLQQKELSDTRTALQDSRTEQKSMAKTAKKTALLQTLSARLSSIDIQLQSATQMKLFYLEQLVTKQFSVGDTDRMGLIIDNAMGSRRKITNDKGEKETADSVMKSVQLEIDALEQERANVMGMIMSRAKEMSLTYM